MPTLYLVGGVVLLGVFGLWLLVRMSRKAGGAVERAREADHESREWERRAHDLLESRKRGDDLFNEFDRMRDKDD